MNERWTIWRYWKAQALYVLTRHLLRIYFQMVLTFTEIRLVYVRYEV